MKVLNAFVRVNAHRKLCLFTCYSSGQVIYLTSAELERCAGFVTASGRLVNPYEAHWIFDYNCDRSRRF
jgi:hypothetical protein